MITKLKKGNNIYIKPKNRGKFREYCNGKVTDECIRRGKNSSDPKIRKRATFAANSRKWKHLEGGILINKYPIVEDSSLNAYFKSHPLVSGMAIGEGMNGIEGSRRIVFNPYITLNDNLKKGLHTIENIRHTMDSINYNPEFQLTPTQIEYRKTKLKGTPYETNDKAFKQSIISRILVGDTKDFDISDELKKEALKFKYKKGGKAFVKSPNVLDSNSNIYKYNKKTKGIKKHALGGITDDLINSIIKEEGFTSTPTNIGDGKITLGSGLTNPKWHKIYKQKGKWTEQDNRKAVKEELEERLKLALDTIPNWNKLNDNQQKAFLSYNYNYNITPKNSPKFFLYMKSGLFDLAGKEMNATSNNPKFKQGLLERRLREQILWNTPVSPLKIRINEPILTEQPSTLKISNTYYPSIHRIIPTKEGSYIATDEGQIFKNIMDNRMKVKLIMTPKKPEPYKFPILFLNGGIIKAQKGTNFLTKADKFLNSNLGKGVMNIGTQLFSNIKNSKKASDYINQDNQRIRAGKEAILSNIDVSDETRNQLNLLQVLNPDIHYGEIDLLLMLLKLYQQARKKKMNEANAWEQELIDKQKELVDAIQGNGTMDFSGLISNGVSALSKYLGNPKVTSNFSSSGTTQLNYDFGIKLNTPNIQKPYWMK